MAQQSSNGNRPKLSEKGLLTPENCVVALIDHQGQMLFGTSNFDRQGIINNTVALGKAARVFDVPMPRSRMSAETSGGVRSSASLIALTMVETHSLNAPRMSLSS